jgi:micrococcal nuclease
MIKYFGNKKMNQIPLLLLLLQPLNVHAENYKILRVIDGDTVLIEAPFIPDPLSKQISLRINGIDTPEKGFRGACDIERKKALDATALTKSLIQNSRHQEVILKKWDKFGGRIDGDIILDGKPLSRSLIEAGMAREYHGEKKLSWCK